jgi:hypothetical protein
MLGASPMFHRKHRRGFIRETFSRFNPLALSNFEASGGGISALAHALATAEPVRFELIENPQLEAPPLEAPPKEPKPSPKQPNGRPFNVPTMAGRSEKILHFGCYLGSIRLNGDRSITSESPEARSDQ